MSKRVVVIGGGASGLMCAYELAKGGAQVTVLERNDRVGKKLLCTGNGKCNLTNTDASAKAYNSAFVENALSKYTPQEIVSRFKAMGLLVRIDSEGRVYPYCESATAVLNVFLRSRGNRALRKGIQSALVEWRVRLRLRCFGDGQRRYAGQELPFSRRKTRTSYDRDKVRYFAASLQGSSRRKRRTGKGGRVYIRQRRDRDAGARRSTFQGRRAVGSVDIQTIFYACKISRRSQEL